MYYDVFFEVLLPKRKDEKVLLRIDIEAQKLICNGMNKHHCSLEEAMDLLDLPLSEYDYYAELLKKKMN